ncbi:hypothetical protein EHRUM2_06380 [Ehrlichia ruminantium]|uniref:DUF3023 domain-containing protein n=1 Tax=Ehrlichia ruminantium TaxID=779 RepID=A0A170RZ38_EHRRU|nr:hypothetical protein [Ehrlichia ruminantium]GAT77415.1 hypothetical protein EHRUM2_06380 [Ehrlichia ruminantium]
MLFKYNPENTKQLHDEALQCLRNLKIYAHSHCCIGTEINGVLNVIINQDKSGNLCEPQAHKSLFYIECSISSKRVFDNPPISNMMKAVIRKKIARTFFNYASTVPTVDVALYTLIDNSKLNMLIDEHLMPTHNIENIGNIILCKPLSVANGSYSLDMDFDEEEALKSFGGLQNATFTKITKTSPITRKSAPNKLNYSQLLQHDQKEVSVENISIRSAVGAENVSPSQQSILSATKDISSLQRVSTNIDISFFTNLANSLDNFEKNTIGKF